MNLEELRERAVRLNSDAHDIRARSEAEKRDLTTEEAVQLDQLLDAADRCAEDIKRLERLGGQTARLSTGQGRKTEPDPPARMDGDGTGNVQLNRPQGRQKPDDNPRLPAEYIGPKNGGFRSLGDMAYHVRRACVEGGFTDPRLERLASATTYAQEGVGADGGFAVPIDFRTEIMTTIMAEDSLLSRCDQVTCSGNTFTCPADETTPWQSTGGIQATWDGEAAAATQSKPALQDRTIKLNKLRALVPVTEEMLEDAASLDSYLRRKAPQKIAFKINLALISGTGAGMPLGILNSPGLVTVAKETSQTAATLIAANVFKMYNRMYGPSRQNAIWLYNQEIEPQLFKLAMPGTDNVGNAVTTWGSFVWLPANGVSGSPYSTLFGRPCIPTQACAALGTVGDILFVDWSQYLALLKSGPNPRVDVSMHLWFDQDLTAYKFSLRMGGMPWWSTTAAPLSGSNTYSPYVALATR